jgi:YfiH family protein
MDSQSVRHGFFGRRGGVSEGLYSELNCGFGSRDDPRSVAENRRLALGQLGTEAPLLANPYQLHGIEVAIVEAAWAPGDAPKADAVVTARSGIPLGVLTADCAPVLLVDREHHIAAAAHAGWRGALNGVIEATIAAMLKLGARRETLIAAIGPCIGEPAYEVGAELEALFVQTDPQSAEFFSPGALLDKRQLDLGRYVEARLARAGVPVIDRAGLCTYSLADRYFSYRRATHRGESDYGRCLSAIMLVP